ncbi:integrator complex subunit 2 isoform X2 [Episyrphus balteatus]|uniref:integrator complex subunit 2 isoform X2 n=1 Tax=Episyrphus balteatus TaxID=286459 RepID=UPI002486B10F|nr:integrator complex subunit 2 isoform X2 [Episyrphus balteatus]
MNENTVSNRVFEAMQNLNIQELSSYTQNEIRPILPSLVRMSLLSPLDNTKSSMDSRKQILALLVGIEVVNNIVAFLQVNYHELETDLKKEQQTRQKGSLSSENLHLFGLQSGIALGFERADVTRKVRVVLSEIFYIQTQLLEYTLSNNRSTGEFLIKQSELFEDGIYLEEIIDIICISLAELPSLLNVQELIDVLVYVNNGPRIICSIVANFPDCYRDVVSNMITNCDEDLADGKLKLAVLYALSEMNPKQALSTRAVCVDLMKVPSFMLRLSLKYPQDLIAFISGMLLGNDQVVRSWFAGFVRSSQKRKGDALHIAREELLQQLKHLVNLSHMPKSSEDYTVKASALLRLYCALRGIAGIKFNEDEISFIMQLITTRPTPTQSLIRFVSLGLCMLIASPSLIANPNLEAKAIEWMHWLIKEESFLSNNSGTSSSLGELICSTLHMKIPIRPNSTSRMKQIFTQDLFSEQVVAAHAVKVPVTLNLNANIPGYLPVHCIHQLLKCKTFLKHKVTIKSWIYKQICNCRKPLHPVMPALIEVYVNSLILPNQGSGSGKFSSDHLHKPLSETEILRIFTSSNSEAFKLNFDHVPGQYDFGEIKNGETDDGDDLIKISCSLTSQLLVLYYLVLYEDTRLCNTSMIVMNGRKAKSYSNEFLSELPIKFLLQKAQKYQHEYVGLFHPLLRLLVSNFPHLSMVDDWIEKSTSLVFLSSSTWLIGFDITEQHLIDAFDELDVNPSNIMKILRAMLKRPPTDLWRFATVFVKNINKMLETSVPRLIKELYRKVWLRLNSILPKRLWVETINAVMPQMGAFHTHNFVHENVLLDPLHILRCNEKVFRCPDVLIIVLRILQASLAASKAQLNRHIQDKPMFDKNGQLQSEMEREELKTALIASQESAAVQILLEASIKKKTDIIRFGTSWTLREIHGIVCSYIHHAFISEPSLAKLVHFQTYPRELLGIAVRGVPSMHICIDFLHEILGMPEMERQIFTIDLTSYLVLRYSIPKSLSVAKLCVSTVLTLLGLLSNDAKVEMFNKILPAIVRFSEAFPVLLDDCISFLIQAGRSLYSRDNLGRDASCTALLPLQTSSKSTSNLRNAQSTKKLVLAVEQSFSNLMDDAVSQVELY